MSIATTPGVAPIAAYFEALDAAYDAYAAALRRRLAACRERHRLEGKKGGPLPALPHRLGWFPFGGKLNSDTDIFSNPPPQSTNALGNNG